MQTFCRAGLFCNCEKLQQKNTKLLQKVPRSVFATTTKTAEKMYFGLQYNVYNVEELEFRAKCRKSTRNLAKEFLVHLVTCTSLCGFIARLYP